MANALDYVNFDFDDMVEKLQARLSSTDAWKDIYQSSTGEMLIDLLAFVLNYGLFYTERRAQESFLSTAQLRSSVVNLVSLINYVPKRKTSSTGTLTFSIPAVSTKIVHIPKYTECQSADGLKILTNEAAAIEKGATSVTVKAVQGSLVTKELTSDGSLNQEYLLNDTSVENSADTDNPTFNVTVEGETWTLVSTFINSDNDDKVYRIINEMDSKVSVLFGDNVNGASPTTGDVVKIQYVRSSGAEGNISNTAVVTTVNDTLYDEDSAVVTVTVTNNATFLGGDAEEDIEEIRYEAPRIFKTGDRAVNKDDFISLLENYPGVACANAWGENEEAVRDGVAAVSSMLNKVKMIVLLQDWLLADSTFKETLGDYLYQKSMMTVKYEFLDPEILEIWPRLWVKVLQGNSLTQAQTDINNILVNQFALGTTTRLGAVLKHSNIISAIQELDAISYVNVELEVKESLSSSYNSINDFGATLKVLNVKPGTVRLFLNGSYATVDANQEDGTGTFTLTGTFTGSGSINYSTGVITLDTTPDATTCYVRYQQDELGNIVTGFDQICKLNDNDGDFVSLVIDE